MSLDIEAIRRNVAIRDRNRNINRSAKAASTGAVVTAGALSLPSALGWAVKPNAMKEIVSDCGGKGNYAKAFAIGLAAFTLAGAAVNTTINLATNNAHKNPINKSAK